MFVHLSQWISKAVCSHSFDLETWKSSRKCCNVPWNCQIWQMATQARDICRRTWQIDLMLHGDRLIGQVSIGGSRLIMNIQKTNKSSLKVDKSNIYQIISSEKQINFKYLVLKCSSPNSCRWSPLPGHLGVKESEAEFTKKLFTTLKKSKNLGSLTISKCRC